MSCCYTYQNDSISADSKTNLELTGGRLEGGKKTDDDTDGVNSVVVNVEFGPGAWQVPGATDPLRHLQDVEQELSGVPLAGPSSHSSPNFGSYMPFPQPAGVAPFTMM